MKCFRCMNASREAGAGVWIFCRVKGAFVENRETCDSFKEDEDADIE